MVNYIYISLSDQLILCSNSILNNNNNFWGLVMDKTITKLLLSSYNCFITKNSLNIIIIIKTNKKFWREFGTLTRRLRWTEAGHVLYSARHLRVRYRRRSRRCFRCRVKLAALVSGFLRIRHNTFCAESCVPLSRGTLTISGLVRPSQRRR